MTLDLSALVQADPGLFLPALDVHRREELFAAFVEALAAQGVALHADALLRLLVEREALGTTGLGGGVAIPHARSFVVGRPAIACARLRRALDYGAADGVPVQVALLVVAPYGNAGSLYAPLLAAVADAAHEEAARRDLLGIETFEDFAAVLRTTLRPRLRQVLAR